MSKSQIPWAALGATLMARRYNLYGAPQSARLRQRATVRAASRGARRARVSRGRTKVLYKRKYNSQGGVLGGTNSDTRLIYRKKSMPRRMRRRWKSFVKKVNAVSERELGTRTVLWNDTINQTQTTTGLQSCLTLALYGASNGGKDYLNDLRLISQLENTGNPTAAAGGTVDQSTKMIFTSAVMDITIRNSSTFTQTANQPALDGRAAIELDMYEISCRKDTADDATAHNEISSMLNAYDTKEIGGTGSGIQIQDRGATPFEFGNSIGRFGMKIWKKTKYFIPNNQTITYQIRDPKRHVTTFGTLDKNDGWNQKGWTRMIFLIYKLVPGLEVGTIATPNTFQCQLTVGNTRVYKYKVEGFNEDRERLGGAAYNLTNAAN
jgi:hypothetical protein